MNHFPIVLADSIPPIVIIIAAILGVALIVAIFLVFHFTVFAHRRLKKQVSEYLRVYEYLHALVFGQDAQFVKRLEMISVVNLLYVDIHMRFNKRYKEIKDVDDAAMTNVINKMKDLLNDHNYAALKNMLPDVKKKLAAYEERVSSLNADLLTVVKPEEECRERSLQLKERFRALKSEYYAKQSELAMMSGSYEKIFERVEKDFSRFESLVEGAQYQEAQELLPKVEAVITQLEKVSKTLPNICLTIQSVIPEKLASLEHAYSDMIAEEYPLGHIISQRDFDSIKKQIDDLAERIQLFQLGDVQNEFDGILERIDEYFTLFENEKEAKAKFESEVQGVYDIDNGLEKKFIKLSNGLPDVRKIFLISQDEQAKIDALKSQINQVGATKRTLDNLIHSPQRQPYSLLLEKMNKLEEEAEAAKTSLDDFENYLLSLKVDSEAGVAFVADFYGRLKEAEKKLRDINLESVYNRYLDAIDAQYALADETYYVLRSTPIDVNKVNTLVARLQGEGGELISNILGDYEKMLYSEAAIVYANRKRSHFGEMNSILTQAEGLYYSGEFDKCYEETITELKRRQDS